MVSVDNPFGQFPRWYRLVDLRLDANALKETCTACQKGVTD